VASSFRSRIVVKSQLWYRLEFNCPLSTQVHVPGIRCVDLLTLTLTQCSSAARCFCFSCFNFICYNFDFVYAATEVVLMVGVFSALFTERDGAWLLALTKCCRHEEFQLQQQSWQMQQTSWQRNQVLVGVLADDAAESRLLPALYQVDWSQERHLQAAWLKGGLASLGSAEEQTGHELWDDGTRTQVSLIICEHNQCRLKHNGTQENTVHSTLTLGVKRPVGDAENAGLENAGPSKMQGWKTQDWKTWDQICRGGKRRTSVYGTRND